MESKLFRVDTKDRHSGCKQSTIREDLSNEAQGKTSLNYLSLRLTQLDCEISEVEIGKSQLVVVDTKDHVWMVGSNQAQGKN